MPNIHKQTGSTLIVSMMMLLLLTILALTTMNTVTMEERMAGNYLDHNLAFQAAEAGLRDAETWIGALTSGVTFSTDGSTRAWEKDAITVTMEDQDTAWWADNGVEYGDTGSHELTSSTADPYSIIEESGIHKDNLDPSSKEYIQFFRATSRGEGGSENAVSVLQTSVGRRIEEG